MVPDYGCFLRKGLGGAQEEIRKRRRPLSSVERNFYEAMEITRTRAVGLCRAL